MKFIDDIGQSFKAIALEDCRIISLVPSQTEFLVDMGLKANIVGITKFCVHPVELREEIPIVGGTKQVHMDKIKAQKPTLIIANKEENTQAMVEELLEIAPVWVTDMNTIDEVLKSLQHLADYLQVGEKAKVLFDEVKKEKASFEDFMKDKTWKKVLYFIWKDPYMAAGRATFINDFLALNKWENILEEETRYPEVYPDTTTKPDVLLLSSEPYPFAEKHQAELESDWNTPSLLIDGEYFSWYGSRMKQAFKYFRSLHLD